MQPKLFILPRWGGSTDTDWYAWLSGQLIGDYDVNVQLLTPPGWTEPRIGETVDFLDQQLPPLTKHDFLIGHSIGNLAWLHLLTARLARGDTFRVGGLLAVAGWFTVDEPWAPIRPWLANDNLLYRELAACLGQCRVVLSGDDPFTSDQEQNRDRWTERLGAKVTLHADRGHFNQEREPLILRATQELLTQAGPDGTRPSPALPLRAQDPPIVIQETYEAPLNRVWQALTDHWHMQQWYFEQLEDFRPAVGFTTQFAVHNAGRIFTHQWRVTEVDAPHRICYMWQYPEYPGLAFTDFTLKETDRGTALTLTMLILEDFPTGVPEFTRASCRAGWDYFIGQRLRQYLERK